MDRVITIKNREARRRQAALECRLRELSGTSFKREELQIESVADPLDQITTNVGRDIAVHELEYRAHALWDVEAALLKLKDGGYGECEECAEPISARRLTAVPWARLCLACQSRAESHAEIAAPVHFDRAA